MKITPFSSLPTDMRKLLGSEYNWASWLCHPLSGYGVHFFLKGFELGKMQGNMLLELSLRPTLMGINLPLTMVRGMILPRF